MTNKTLKVGQRLQNIHTNYEFEIITFEAWRDLIGGFHKPQKDMIYVKEFTPSGINGYGLTEKEIAKDFKFIEESDDK